jgi:hypothetical protein
MGDAREVEFDVARAIAGLKSDVGRIPSSIVFKKISMRLGAGLGWRHQCRRGLQVKPRCVCQGAKPCMADARKRSRSQECTRRLGLPNKLCVRVPCHVNEALLGVGARGR